MHRPKDSPWNVDDWHRREWLCTDGRGGYACGNALDLPTRRYHSWLTVMDEAGAGRRLRILAGVDERVDCGDGEGDQPWSIVHWGGKEAPDVPELQRAFTNEPVPCWSLGEGDASYDRSLLMPAGKRAVVVKWRNTGRLPLVLVVRPLFDFVDADALGQQRDLRLRVEPSLQVAPRAGVQEHALCLRPEPADADGRALPDVFVTMTHDAFTPGDSWYTNYHLAEEAARGYDARTDRLAPGYLRIELAIGESFCAAFAIDEPLSNLEQCYDEEVARRNRRLEWSDDGAVQALTGRLRRGVRNFG